MDAQLNPSINNQKYNATNVLTAVGQGIQTLDESANEGMDISTSRFPFFSGIIKNPNREKLAYINKMAHTATNGAEVVSQYNKGIQNKRALKQFVNNQKGAILGSIREKSKNDIASQISLLLLSRRVNEINFEEADEDVAYSLIDKLTSLSIATDAGMLPSQFIKENRVFDYLDDIKRNKQSKFLNEVSNSDHSIVKNLLKGGVEGLTAPAVELLDGLIDIPFHLQGTRRVQILKNLIESASDSIIGKISEEEKNTTSYKLGLAGGNVALVGSMVASGIPAMEIFKNMGMFYLGREALQVIGLDDRTTDNILSATLALNWGKNFFNKSSSGRGAYSGILENDSSTLKNYQNGYSKLAKSDPLSSMQVTSEAKNARANEILADAFKKEKQTYVSNFNESIKTSPQESLDKLEAVSKSIEKHIPNYQEERTPVNLMEVALANECLSNDVPLDLTLIPGETGKKFATAYSENASKNDSASKLLEIQGLQREAFSNSIKKTVFGEDFVDSLDSTSQEIISDEFFNQFLTTRTQMNEQNYDMANKRVNEVIKAMFDSSKFNKNQGRQSIIQRRTSKIKNSFNKKILNIRNVENTQPSSAVKFEAKRLESALKLLKKKGFDPIKNINEKLGWLENDPVTIFNEEELQAYTVINEAKKEVGKVLKQEALDKDGGYNSDQRKGLEMFYNLLREHGLYAIKELTGNDAIVDTIKRADEVFKNEIRSFESILREDFGAKNTIKKFESAKPSRKLEFLRRKLKQLEKHMDDFNFKIDSSSSPKALLTGGEIRPNSSLISSLDKIKNKVALDMLKSNGLVDKTGNYSADYKKLSALDTSKFENYLSEAQFTSLEQSVDLAKRKFDNEKLAREMYSGIVDLSKKTFRTLRRSKTTALLDFIEGIKQIISSKNKEKSVSSELVYKLDKVLEDTSISQIIYGIFKKL